MSCAWIWRGETRELDDAARRSVAGSFLLLSAGYTHLDLADPEHPPWVVLIHGFSVPYFIWDPTFDALVKEGLGVMRYDLYGRGHSDRPRADYDLDLYVDQLLELLDAVGATSVHLVGLSMGGLIAAAFTTRHPARVRKLILIAPAGVQRLPQPPIFRLALLPGVGELLLGMIGTGPLLRGVASDFYEPGHVEMFLERYRQQMELRGFKRAILSTLRHGLLDPHPEIYADLARLGTPTLLIWGENDRTVPFEQHRLLRSLMPQAAFHALPACGHLPHYEKPTRVNRLLVDFIRGENASPG